MDEEDDQEEGDGEDFGEEGNEDDMVGIDEEQLKAYLMY